MTIAVAAMVIVFMGCGSANGNDQGKLNVVTTTTILADMVRNISGDLAEVRAIVPPGADAHVFQPSPDDSVSVTEASVVVSNGGDLDEFLNGMLEGATSSSTLHVVASLGLTDDEHDEHDAPYFWQNPVHAMHYIRLLRDGLSEADPENASTYADRAEAYIEDLTLLDREISRTLEQVPPDKRHLFSFHDAFGHFAERYGWTVSSLVHRDAGDVTPNYIVELV